MLSGISSDYYLRLEQGRDRNPSTQVLESVARVLHLDHDATTYLLSLGGDTPRRTRRRSRKETVPLGIAKLLATLPLPAFVEGRCFDVLAANPLATAFSPRLTVGANRVAGRLPRPGRAGLPPGLGPGHRGPGWPVSASPSAPIPDDPRVIELVGELSLASPRFRQIWARQDVHGLKAPRPWSTTPSSARCG